MLFWRVSAGRNPSPYDRIGGVSRAHVLGGLGCALAVAILLTAGALRPGTAARGAQASNNLRRIVIALHQYEVGAFREIPPIDWGDGFVARRGLCFDKPALDAETGRKIGEVTECFVEVREDNGGLAVRNVSFIKLPEGSIVARHRTTLQPMLDPRSPATHLVGAQPDPGDFNVVAATGRVKGATGQARIVGLVDLKHFRPDAESGIKFHEWIYLIELSRPGPGRR